MTSCRRPVVDVLSATLNWLAIDVSDILRTQIDSCSSKLFEGSTLTFPHILFRDQMFHIGNLMSPLFGELFFVPITVDLRQILLHYFWT